MCKGSCRRRRLRDCKREEKPEGIKQERKRQSLRLATRKGESRRENMTAQATKPSVRRRSSAAQRTRFSGLSLAEIRSPKEFQRLPPFPPLQNLFRVFFMGGAEIKAKVCSRFAKIHQANKRFLRPKKNVCRSPHGRGGNVPFASPV